MTVLLRNKIFPLSMDTNWNVDRGFQGTKWNEYKSCLPVGLLNLWQFPRGKHICSGEMGFPIAKLSGLMCWGVAKEPHCITILWTVKPPRFFFSIQNNIKRQNQQSRPASLDLKSYSWQYTAQAPVQHTKRVRQSLGNKRVYYMDLKKQNTCM